MAVSASSLGSPGVYVFEKESEMHPITGVPTSVTAFIGRALLGPVNEPVSITSFPDFTRKFGGLWEKSALGHAVSDFYQYGGSQAIIVRLHHPKKPVAGGNDDPSIAHIDLQTKSHETYSLYATSPGEWGNKLKASLDNEVLADVAADLNLTKDDVFNLTITDTGGGITEKFANVSFKDSARRIDEVLADSSELVRWEEEPKLPLQITAADFEWPQLKDVPASGGSDGDDLDQTDFLKAGKEGLYALNDVSFNILCIPPYLNIRNGNGGDVNSGLLPEAAKYCNERNAFFIIDSPSGATMETMAKWGVGGLDSGIDWGDEPNVKDAITERKNAAIFFPRIKRPNPLRGNQIEVFAPSGALAGIFSRNDAANGVWSAPAGTDASLNGISDLSVSLNDIENGVLNRLGINCLRWLPAAGPVVWGARTREGDDRRASEFKYINVRRLTLYIKQTIKQSSDWITFKNNAEPYWAKIRRDLGAFMQSLYAQGAFVGATKSQAYYVKCDSETNPPELVNQGILTVEVGFRAGKPAEFIVFTLAQMLDL